MDRRTYLASVAAATASVGGCTAMGQGSTSEEPDIYQEDRVVYQIEGVNLEIAQDTVEIGGKLKFTVTNTGRENITLGCRNPWAIQKYADDEWSHVTWTKGRYHLMCLTGLNPDSSLSQSLTFSESALEEQATEIQDGLAPGKYRLLLLGTSPYLAADFKAVKP
jgi:hypothetical protein